MAEIRDRIREIREKLNLTQRVFSKSIYLSPSFYGKVENGHRNANERIIELICNKYNVNKQWLLTGKGKQFESPPPDAELTQLMDAINELDPLFREYIIKQVKQLAELHRKSREKTDSRKIK
jgi:transcriptional regulator with XRE-family HTH domain